MELYEIYDFADKKGIIVESFGLKHLPCFSIMDNDSDCFIAIDPMQLDSESDEKVKLAHELGHCEKGAFYNRYSPFSSKSQCEYRADKWAIEKLLPKDELEEAAKKGMQIWELAEHFEVTEEFIKKAMWIYFDKKIA